MELRSKGLELKALNCEDNEANSASSLAADITLIVQRRCSWAGSSELSRLGSYHFCFNFHFPDTSSELFRARVLKVLNQNVFKYIPDLCLFLSLLGFRQAGREILSSSIVTSGGGGQGMRKKGGWQQSDLINCVRIVSGGGSVRTSKTETSASLAEINAIAMHSYVYLF